jgi:hypothetical protein
MPVSAAGGIPEKKASNAASPPADAPMPTTGKLFPDGVSAKTASGAADPFGAGAAFGSEAREAGFLLFELLFLGIAASLFRDA